MVWRGFEPVVVPAFVFMFLGEPSLSKLVWSGCTPSVCSGVEWRLSVLRVTPGTHEEPGASRDHLW